MAADGEAVSTPVAPVDHRKAAKRGLGVVITGATKGFGFALAMELLSLGDRLVICGRDEERTQNAVAALKSAYPEGQVWGVRCDVSEPQQVAALGSFARAQLGTVDRWVNNAASITQKVPLWETQPEELLRVTNTNVAGAFLCCREAVNRMREQPDIGAASPTYHIFNFGFSPWGAALSSAVCTHKATKTGLAQLNTSLRKELQTAGVTGIGVHNLSPGMVLTDLLLKGASPVARRIFNALAEEPETVAAALAPKVRDITGTGRSVEYLTLPDAVRRMATGVPQIVQGGRFFDKDGERVEADAKSAYKPNGTRLLYADAAKEENNA